MPFRRRGRSRSNALRPVNSIKNIIYRNGSLSTTNQEISLAIADDTLTLDTNCRNGCTINQVWLSIDLCGTFTAGANNAVALYIIKNPGNNLTLPAASTEGTSNEKKFIFWSRQAMVMRIQDGGNVYHWEGWIKIPKIYRRMGTDDTIDIAIREIISSSTGHFTLQALYKWYF